MSIEGHKDCMGTKEIGSATFVCLYPDQPENCKDEAWWELREMTAYPEMDEYLDWCDYEDYDAGISFT